ncbi:hypothetical protein, partial [Rhodothermus marinus]|uniref:hypothetical protein n=1 Tax=Rhodothermus marinus TaxID=29549 RepID=UPI001FB41EF3
CAPVGRRSNRPTVARTPAIRAEVANSVGMYPAGMTPGSSGSKNRVRCVCSMMPKIRSALTLR